MVWNGYRVQNDDIQFQVESHRWDSDAQCVNLFLQLVNNVNAIISVSTNNLAIWYNSINIEEQVFCILALILAVY